MASKHKITRILLLAGGLALVGVLVAVFVVVVLSRAVPVHTFGLGETTGFGLVDGHLEAQVVEARRQTEHDGRVLHTIRVELRSSTRKMALDPGIMNVVVFDAAGNRYEPQVPAEAASGAWHYPSLRPGGLHGETFLFQQPAQVVDPQLWITPKTFLSGFLRGGEQSRFQAKLVFSLEATPQES